ncbi:MAG: transcriptional regulator [Saprospiraceae bacterium]|nr:MAG: transcriptional regulator [Saprospiraceae bacterium]
MNLQQLQYIIAVDTYRNFAKAAQSCFVTQPTLSMMIQKLEQELALKIFDRSKQPVIPTATGQLIIEQARRVLKESQRIPEIVDRQKGKVSGELRLGIIPTLAPYLLPLFINQFLQKYPEVKVSITEFITDHILQSLKKGTLDAGILVTPIDDTRIREYPLFYEPFHVYTTHQLDKEYYLPEDIDPNELWLLEEGHCFRTQIIKLCELRKSADRRLQYQAGSIETLKRMVESQHGITVLPQLALKDLTEQQLARVKPFAAPCPVREVSLVTHRDFIKKQLIEKLQEEIMAAVPKDLKRHKVGRVVGPL